MSAWDKHKGSWLSFAASLALPDIRRQFDRNRDPLIRAQIDDLAKTEAQRREDRSGGRGASMVKKDKPAPRMKPPQATANAAEKKNFGGRWLAEQRDAAFAGQKAKQTQKNFPQRQRGRELQEPSR